jgi:hypothetical protein
MTILQISTALNYILRVNRSITLQVTAHTTHPHFFVLPSLLFVSVASTVDHLAFQFVLVMSENFEDDEDAIRLSSIMAQLDLVSVLEAKDIYDSLVQAYPTTLGKSVSKKERDELV